MATCEISPPPPLTGPIAILGDDDRDDVVLGCHQQQQHQQHVQQCPDDNIPEDHEPKSGPEDDSPEDDDPDLVLVEAEAHDCTTIQRSLFCLGNTDSLVDPSIPNLVTEEDNGFKLFIGGVNAAMDTRCLRANGITRVLNAAAISSTYRVGLRDDSLGVSFAFEPSRKLFVEDPIAFYKSNTPDAGIEAALGLPIIDSEDFDITPHFPPAFKFISSAEKCGAGVLVCCENGIGQSAAVILSYILKSRRFTLVKGALVLRAASPYVAPNREFVKALTGLERDLGLTWAERSV